MNEINFQLNGYYTLILAAIVLFIGGVLVKKISFLEKYNIPTPVAGGLLMAIILLFVHQGTGIALHVQSNLKDGLMLMFFSSIGLSADFKRLRAGGKPLVIFTIIVGAFILLQNFVGVGLAYILGQNPFMGLMAGSITLTGGHGTAGAWGPILENKYGFVGATSLGMACATFGLIIGGVIGGPVAANIIKSLKGVRKMTKEEKANFERMAKSGDTFENPKVPRLIDMDNAIETLTLFAICMASSYFLFKFFSDKISFTIPQFVWALATGVIVRNFISIVFKVQPFDRCIDLFGNVALSFFLAMALIDLKLWQLASLALPLMVILVIQTIVMILYARYVTYNFMGKDYDSAVLTAGHCGFGMGATPTAVANMQSITERYGPSHKAFLIVPMVGAFFVDLINASALTLFINFLQ